MTLTGTRVFAVQDKVRPAKIAGKQVLGFSLFLLQGTLDGNMDELAELIAGNLHFCSATQASKDLGDARRWTRRFRVTLRDLTPIPLLCYGLLVFVVLLLPKIRAICIGQFFGGGDWRQYQR